MHPFETLNVPQNAVGIHWFGQSSYSLKDAVGTIVQVDPYFPHERSGARYIHTEPPLDEAALRTDYVLLTHNHGDHTCPETLERIAGAHPKAHFVGTTESVENMTQHGIDEGRLETIEEGARKRVGPMTVWAVVAQPSGGSPEDGIASPNTTHLGFVVDFGGIRVYISGDPINTFAEHDHLLEPIRAFRPDIGLLTTHPTEGEFPFFDGSAKMAAKLGLKAAVPAHYDCFVERTYDPQEWATALQGSGAEPIIIPYNQSIVYQP